MIRKIFDKYSEVILYLFFGGLTTIVSIGSYVIFLRILEGNALIANIISWVFAVLFAYITNRIWVFHSKNKGIRSVLKELASFFSGRIATLVMEEAILWVGIEWLSMGNILIKIIAQVFVVIANYIISKFFIF